MQTLTVKPGREKSLQRRHPWLFAGAVARTEGDATDGLCQVRSHRGEPLGTGIVSPADGLLARVVRFDGRPLDREWIAARVADALHLRARILPPNTDAYRAINSEGDLVPGLIVDRYGDDLAVQVSCSGAEGILPWLLAALAAARPMRRVVIRRDGQPPQVDGAVATPETAIRECGLSYLADLVGGQKTGFFLDQRPNRSLARAIADGRSVLNAFAYSGGFGVAALAGGASGVVQLDVSAPALELARRNHELNHQDAAATTLVVADAFDWLRATRAEGRRYGLVILDPPAFVKSKAALERGARGYKDVNLQAMAVVEPGGYLMTFSCSGLVDAALFQKIVFGASADAGVRFRLLRRLGAGEDHPVLLDCPEGEYLKGLLLQRIDA